jgi:prophage DNA circulation protein
MLKAKENNPAWVMERLCAAVREVSAGSMLTADFIVMDERADQTTFINYVRLAMLSTLLGDQHDSMHQRLMIGFQQDVTQFLPELPTEDAYDHAMTAMRHRFAPTSPESSVDLLHANAPVAAQLAKLTLAATFDARTKRGRDLVESLSQAISVFRAAGMPTEGLESELSKAKATLQVRAPLDELEGLEQE